MSVISGDDPVSPALEWEETHNPTTDADGRFEVLIGTGSRTGGIRANFYEIKWDSTAHFLKVEMDVSGAGVFTVMGTTQFLSVPYAFSSSKAAFADTCLYAASMAVCSCTLQEAYDNGYSIKVSSNYRPLMIDNGSFNSYTLLARLYGSGTGTSGAFRNYNPNNTHINMYSFSAATNVNARAGMFGVYNSVSQTHAIQAYTKGTGSAIYGWTPTSCGINSYCGVFSIEKNTNIRPAVYGKTFGIGSGIYGLNTSLNPSATTAHAGYFMTTSTDGLNPSHTVKVDQWDLGDGVNSNLLNPNTVNMAAVRGTAVAQGAGVMGINNGVTNGYAGFFQTFQAANTATAGLRVNNWGQGNGIRVTAFQPTGYGIQASSQNYSGWFGPIFPWPASVGIYVNGDVDKFGVNNAVVRNAADQIMVLPSIESAEVWFEDFGFGTLVDGEVVISIEPEFLTTINTTEPYHVHIQLEGLCAGGVIVTDKTPASFRVVHTPPGSSQQCDAPFSYRITAKRKGYENLRLSTIEEKRVITEQHIQNMWPETVTAWEQELIEAQNVRSQLLLQADKDKVSMPILEVDPGDEPDTSEFVE